MTPDRFAEILDFLDLNRRRLATNEGWDPRLVRRWQQDVVPIPEEVGDWLERLMAYALLHPRPPDDPSQVQEEDTWLEGIIAVVGDAPPPRREWFQRAKKPLFDADPLARRL